MEKFYFEEPTLERKDEALDFLYEFVLYNSELNGTGSMDKCLEGVTYEEFLIESKKRQEKDYAYSIGRCPSKTFFFIRESDNKIIGMSNIRYSISKDLLERGASHIGYCIRPTERNKGYNKIQLYIALLEEKKINENTLLLNCTANNIASNKTILSLGGTLIKSAIDPNDGEMTNYYHIDVTNSIELFYDTYQKYILNEKK